MADSLVKNDDGQKSGTSAIWRNIREMLDSEYPEAALVSEWSSPPLSLKAGFHADFLLDHPGGGYQSLVRDYRLDGQGRPVEDSSFFKKSGSGDICRFLDQYLPWYESTKNDGFISLISGNHDTPRLSRTLSPEELALFYGFLFTMPGVPFLYYGDEIGMRYLDLPSKEGGYTRTGSRTPMQWNGGANKGFSSATADKLYLPVDPDSNAPSVEAQEKDPKSLLNTVKALLRLRRAEPDLQGRPNLEILHSRGLPFIYRRGAFIIAVNPGESPASARIPADRNAGNAISASSVYSIGGARLENGFCGMEGQSFGIWRG
jgi:maltose alpha-D-glucosyltransferase/alpha-amylase